ncbi:dTDP-glucose 4,6-dehydratase [Desulfovibrio aminophilus]|nr:dTDP-glucose 4,6-dehydratase [Desulfovibrio aminophilus]MCM0756295.1 dTDP-glucose 4,6-dehydratase [Desulfovibrio aminophilus]
MRLLVTGGCGFIGTNFIQGVLSAHPDWTVVNLDRLTYAGNRHNLLALEQENEGRGDPRYVFVHGDIGNRELVLSLLEEHRLEAVVNFAAESHVDRSINDPAPFLSTNVMGAQNLLECARLRGLKRFVQISTDEVYGSLGPDGSFSEATPLAPNSPYSASKASADLVCRAYRETYGLPVIITRCSNNYGPYQFPEKLIPLMFLKARNGEPLPVYGQGTNVRDWIWVGDHCKGVELALTRGAPGQVYNFGGAAERANLDVVRAILKALGKPESLITFVKDRPGHDQRYAMDFAKAARELGFAPSLDFETGLARTLEWYRDNGAWLESVQSGAYRRFMDEWYGERA